MWYWCVLRWFLFFSIPLLFAVTKGKGKQERMRREEEKEMGHTMGVVGWWMMNEDSSRELTIHCVLDLHEYMGGPNLCPTTPHPITGETVPLTFGHEFSAIVTEVGEGVKDFKEGDRVAVEVRIQ